MRARSALTASFAAGRSPGHTRARGTGSRSPSTSGKSDTFDESLASFAAAYADQNERDYEAFRQAAADGRIEVVEGL